MIASYLKISVKNLLKNKLYSAINVLGLAVGLACCLLIALFVRHELSYDSFFPDSGRIYRLSPDFAATAMGPERHPAANVAPLAPLVRAAGIEGLESVARIGGMRALVAKDGQAFYEQNFRWADEAFLEIFALDWLRGEPAGALDTPGSVVVSESLARRYFGGGDPMGQTLMLENTWPLVVTGVFRDIPANSHLSADLIVPMEMAWQVLDFNYETFNWSYTNFHTYVKLEPGANIENILAQVRNVIAARLDAETAGFFSITEESFGLSAHALKDIHLYSGRAGEFKTPGNLVFVLAFSAIALCLLLVACINFMNLSTARAAHRAREVGMRKAVGARRGQLVTQFLGESLLLSVAAMLFALVLMEMLLPVFSAVVDRPLNFEALTAPGFVFFILVVTLLTGLVAGSYPAFYLSAFNPMKVLRFGGAGATKGVGVRNLLVVCQFSLSIALIVATAVVTLQMRYARDIELGFDKDRVVVLWGTQRDGLGAQWEGLKRELQRHPGISHVTEADMYPGSVGSRHVRIEGGSPEGFDILTKQVGFGFFDTYGIDLVAGREFNPDISSDIFNPPLNVPADTQAGGSYILNEAAVRALGWAPEEALGRHFEVDFSADFSVSVAGPVIGVVEDVHIQSLREPILPLVYFVPAPRWAGQPTFDIASVRLTEGDVAPALEFIETKWRELIPEIPLIHHFLEADFDALYQEEERHGRLFSLFAVLAVVLACLGLFGLAVFAAERRVKEIGVRKVLGSGVWRIVLLLTNDFSRLVLIANLIAWPLAYVAMEGWLSGFAYRIDLTPMIFIGSGLIALCIAWVTVGGTAAKAATARPVLALRYE